MAGFSPLFFPLFLCVYVDFDVGKVKNKKPKEEKEKEKKEKRGERERGKEGER